MLKKVKRVLALLLGTVFVSAGLAAGGLAYYALNDLELGSTPLQFSLKSGSSLRGAAQQMVNAGVLTEPLRFELLARLLGESGNLKAGIYEIDRPLTPLELLRKVTQGDYTQAGITFVEGWTFRQMRKTLDEHSAVRHDTRSLSDAEILQRLSIAQASPEGWFFPDTYYFSSGASDITVLRRAHHLMQSHLAAQWSQRAQNLPFTGPYEALILASIVEKETGKKEERPLIAAVFVNRLRRGMILQADPTVIYGMGEKFDGNIRKHDLTTDTPYNTYTRAGLPPTPIAMPGLAALSATLNPAASDVLYFVARGDGSSHFSRTLAEHERAVTKYQKPGRR